MSYGTRLIVAERQRQIEQEGWTPEHDDEHYGGQLVQAAVCYAREAHLKPMAATPHKWPWDDGWWKPSDDPVRNLVKAAALIAAEIDRLGRQRGGQALLNADNIRELRR